VLSPCRGGRTTRSRWPGWRTRRQRRAPRSEGGSGRRRSSRGYRWPN
jgi:hypothetical protein